MSIPLPIYTKIKNKCCICYFGPIKEFVSQLNDSLPIISRGFPDLEIYLSCDDNLSYLLNATYYIPKSEVFKSRHQFGYITELKYDLKANPITTFLKESEIDF